MSDKKCIDCKYFNRSAWQYPCVTCQDDHSWTPKTNADRIRSMTDKELATLIILNCQGRECPDKSFCHSEEEAAERCWKCWLEWLKQENETN